MRGSLAAVVGEAGEEAAALVFRVLAGSLRTSSMAQVLTATLPTVVGEETLFREVRVWDALR